MTVQGLTAVITGAGSGIGKATALLAAREGMHVIAADIRNAASTAEEIVDAGGQALAVTLDVRDPASWTDAAEAAVSAFGRIDLLANIAGVVSEGPDNAIDQTIEGWERVISTNLRGTWLGIRAALPSMIDHGGGVIVNTASAGGVRGMHNTCSYAASKGGVIALSRQVAIEYATAGVRVNVVCPGIIETPILGVVTDELRAHGAAATPLARFGRPEEIASMVVHLARPESGFITGQVIAIDGGWTAR